jgi:hypothetical protein
LLLNGSFGKLPIHFNKEKPVKMRLSDVENRSSLLDQDIGWE